MIVVVGGIKGGSGKTTIATNLSVMRAHQGLKVVLIDADEQRSASDWADQRTQLGIVVPQYLTVSLSGKGLYAQVEKMRPDYDDIIIDVGGRDTTSQRSALTIANVFLIPFKPRSLDIWTVGAVTQMISEIKAVNPFLKCMAFINQADFSGCDNTDSLNVLKEYEGIECLTPYIVTRKAFSNAAAEGKGICEMKIIDKKAVDEMKAIYDAIYTVG